MGTRSSSQPDQSSPSFFKVIRHPSAAHLSLPNAFVRRYFEKIPKNPTLVTATGNHSWRMKFVKIGEDYCFAHGWEDLVNDVGLCSRDIVVFWLVDSFTFHVTFLGANGCEKHVPVIKTNDDDGECHDKNLWFEKVFGRKSLGYYMVRLLILVNHVSSTIASDTCKLCCQSSTSLGNKIHQFNLSCP
ncbi:putative transcription factor B3-Domain family [Helianthus debilis subsp. tardiflorus]